MSGADASWMHEYAIIRLYREFESLILEAIVGAINNDTSTLAQTTGVKFPKHLTDEVCEYLVTGGRYFDFKGRDGLIKTLKRFVPENHYLLETVRRPAYRQVLERLPALRNYAAHDSEQSRKAALTATGQRRLGSAGAWLKTRSGNTSRLIGMIHTLKELADDIKDAAPF